MRALGFVIGLGVVACGEVVGGSGDGGSFADCRALPETCGPMGNGSCCASSDVAGGTFFRGYDTAVGTTFTNMTRSATVSPFRLDTYEITVGRFRQFVASQRGTQANPPMSDAGARVLNGNAGQGGWDANWNANLATSREALGGALQCDQYATWTDVASSKENHPMVCITWYEAQAFCAWDGGFLPTEAEAMFAASGGNQQRAYPWSNPPDSVAIDCTTANFGGANWPKTACVSAGAQAVGKSSPAGDGLFGQSDLGGNAFEWVLDWAPADTSANCVDCANLVPRTDRLIRGGSFVDKEGAVRTAARLFSFPPDARASFLGARCARAASPSPQ